MTPQELRDQAITKRRAALLTQWEGKVRPQSPPCENCGEAKHVPTPQMGKKKNG